MQTYIKYIFIVKIANLLIIYKFLELHSVQALKTM